MRLLNTKPVVRFYLHATSKGGAGHSGDKVKGRYRGSDWLFLPNGAAGSNDFLRLNP